MPGFAPCDLAAAALRFGAIVCESVALLRAWLPRDTGGYVAVEFCGVKHHDLP